NSGVMAFNTKIIQEDTFSKLNSLFLLYSPINFIGDQPTFNLFFYKKWQHLPRVYNVRARKTHIKKDLSKINGIILHMMSADGTDKPWFPENYYYAEWKNNLKKAENIDISKPTASIKAWSKIKIWVHIFFICGDNFLFNIYYKVDRTLGTIGLFLKKYFPKIYFYLKSH
ncbi:MAG: glycosyltransferase, partial [Candidatus Staskawiczbacteria bacterium]